MTENYSWGLTLDKNKTSDLWDPDVKHDANDSTQSCRGQHSLSLKQVILGPHAKDGEVNVIEVEAKGYRSSKVTCVIAVLEGGSQHQSLLDLLFPDPPVLFRLVKGSGPIHLLGNLFVESGDRSVVQDSDNIKDKPNPTKDNEEKDEKLVECFNRMFLHSTQCVNPKCRFIGCRIIKDRFIHIRDCKLKVGNCPRCKSMFGLYYRHAKYCLVQKCDFSGCARMKEEIKKSDNRRRLAESKTTTEAAL